MLLKCIWDYKIPMNTLGQCAHKVQFTSHLSPFGQCFDDLIPHQSSVAWYCKLPCVQFRMDFLSDLCSPFCYLSSPISSVQVSRKIATVVYYSNADVKQD